MFRCISNVHIAMDAINYQLLSCHYKGVYPISFHLPPCFRKKLMQVGRGRSLQDSNQLQENFNSVKSFVFNLVDRWYRQHLTRFKFEVFTAFRFLLSLSLSLCSTDSLFQSLAHKGSLSFMQSTVRTNSLSLSASPTTCVCCSVLYSVSLSLSLSLLFKTTSAVAIRSSFLVSRQSVSQCECDKT